MYQSVYNREAANRVTNKDLIRSGRVTGFDKWHQFLFDIKHEFISSACNTRSFAICTQCQVRHARRMQYSDHDHWRTKTCVTHEFSHSNDTVKICISVQ